MKLNAKNLNEDVGMKDIVAGKEENDKTHGQESATKQKEESDSGFSAKEVDETSCDTGPNQTNERTTKMMNVMRWKSLSLTRLSIVRSKRAEDIDTSRRVKNVSGLLGRIQTDEDK